MQKRPIEMGLRKIRVIDNRPIIARKSFIKSALIPADVAHVDTSRGEAWLKLQCLQIAPPASSSLSWRLKSIPRLFQASAKCGASSMACW